MTVYLLSCPGKLIYEEVKKPDWMVLKQNLEDLKQNVTVRKPNGAVRKLSGAVKGATEAKKWVSVGA
ncbi:MAG: hypothetical protein ACKVPJ_03125 [Chitinophagales bacterium]